MRKLVTTILLISIMALVSCKNNQYGESKQEYSVLAIKSDSVDLMESYSASIRGRQDIEIYPQVSGTISRVCVQEGEKVKQGQTLFIIDQVSYKAALQTAKANVHAAQAQVETARLVYNSKKELFKENVISEHELATAHNNLTVAEAGLEQAKAAEANARNSFSYTEVKSPSDGIVGILPFRAGALVGSSISQPLTTVSDNSQMYVYFSMTENQLRALMHQYGSPEMIIKQMPAIRLQLNDGSVYGKEGRIESISGIINAQTGTVSIRSVFSNEDRLLLSGGIGNVIVPFKLEKTILIPQAATYELQDKVFAYKVSGGKAVSTLLSVEKLNDGNNYIVRSGLQVGDTIVSEGVGLLQDGMDIAVKQSK